MSERSVDRIRWITRYLETLTGDETGEEVAWTINNIIQCVEPFHRDSVTADEVFGERNA